MNPDRPNAVPSAAVNVPHPVLLTCVLYIQRSERGSTCRPPTERSLPTRLSFADARPARPGEIIELYGTGLGAVQTPVASGAIAPLQAISITEPG